MREDAHVWRPCIILYVFIFSDSIFSVQTSFKSIRVLTMKAIHRRTRSLWPGQWPRQNWGSSSGCCRWRRSWQWWWTSWQSPGPSSLSYWPWRFSEENSWSWNHFYSLYIFSVRTIDLMILKVRLLRIMSRRKGARAITTKLAMSR